MPSTQRSGSVLLRGPDGKLLSESPAMSVLRRAGRDDLAWPLRRLHVPVTPEALVLEIGSGGNPFPRANVLLDAYENTVQRNFQPLITDRPTVLGLIENLPFRDDSFDFIIACHVVEHTTDIVSTLREMQRVARAGYIETPDAFFERVNPYTDHRLELTQRDGEVRIRRKKNWLTDPELTELFEAQVKPSPLWARHLRENPFAFHFRYYWSREDGGIRYRIEGGDAPGFENRGEHDEPAVPKRGIRAKLITAARGVLSQRERNASLDLTNMLRCPGCKGERLEGAPDELTCAGCGARYQRGAKYTRMFPT